MTYLASGREEATDIRQVFPRLESVVSPSVALCRPINATYIANEADVVFVAVPHGVAMTYVPKLLDAGLYVIDLSADYRLQDAQLYQEVYGHPHTDPAHLAEAVYGLPELYRDKLPGARLVANPGCYPTAATLALAPLLAKGLIKPHAIMINAASGVSGAGRKPMMNLMFTERNGGFGPYGQIGGHRHQPEIEQTLSNVVRESSQNGSATNSSRVVETVFVPHLLPITQGILETIYAQPSGPDVSLDDLNAAWTRAYQNEPFVRLRVELPNVNHVAGH